jgi:hypothetical protein
LRDEELLGPVTGGSDSLAWLFNFVREFPIIVTCTSSGNHVPTSWHYKHRAIDIVGERQVLERVMRKAMRNHASLLEAFYDPFGQYIKNGVIKKGAIGGHQDHVHLAH